MNDFKDPIGGKKKVSKEKKPTLEKVRKSNLERMSNVYALGAEFKDPSDLMVAAKATRAAGYKWWDVYSPFPIHGMDKAMGLGPSWVSAFSLVGGILGFISALLTQGLTSIPRPEFLQGVESSWLMHLFYPMVTQGKPFFSLPAFVPILFEMTILFCAFGTVLGFLVMTFLPRLHHHVFNWDLFSRATDDGFFMVIEAIDPKFDEEKTKEFLQTLGGEKITLIPR